MLARGVNITQVGARQRCLQREESCSRIICCCLQLYVDTVGVESYYQEKLQRLFPSMKAQIKHNVLEITSAVPLRVQIVVCKKCDDIYPICSAASICAKVWTNRRKYDTVVR